MENSNDVQSTTNCFPKDWPRRMLILGNEVLADVSGSLPIAELEEFFYEMGEDWHLWDEEEQGQYPIQRIFDAVKKFIAEKKLGNDR